MSSATPPTLRSLFLKGGALSLTLNLSALIVAFASQVILARFLGVEGFGYYSFLLSLLTVATVLATQGLDAWLIRSVPKRLENGTMDLVQGEFRAVSKRVLLMSVAIGGIIFAALSHAVDLLTLSICIVFFIVWNQNIIRQSVLRGLHRPVAARLPDIIVRPLILIVVLLALHFCCSNAGQFLPQWNAWGGQLLGAVLAFVIGGIIINKVLRSVSGSIQPPAAVIFPGATTLLFYSISLVALTELDRLILGAFSTAADVGVYGASFRIAAFVTFAAEALAISFAPLLSTAFARGDRAQTQRLLNTIHRYLLVLTLPIAIVLLFAKEPILAIFGREFTGQPAVLSALILGQIGSIIFFTSGYALTMGGKEREALSVTLLTLIVACAVLPGLASLGLIEFALGAAGFLWLRSFLFWLLAKQTLKVNGSVFSLLFQR